MQGYESFADKLQKASDISDKAVKAVSAIAEEEGWEWGNDTVKMVKEAARRAGFPEDKIIFSGSDVSITMDGEKKFGAASFDAATGEITLYPDFDMMTVFGDVDEDTVFGVMQHEISHGFYSKYDLDKSIYHHSYMDELFSENKGKRFSLLDDIERSISEAVSSGTGKSVSDYAAMYWNTDDYYQKLKAVDETLAEVAKATSMGQDVPKEWSKAYELIKKYNTLYPSTLEGTAY